MRYLGEGTIVSPGDLDFVKTIDYSAIRKYKLLTDPRGRGFSPCSEPFHFPVLPSCFKVDGEGLRSRIGKAEAAAHKTLCQERSMMLEKGLSTSECTLRCPRGLAIMIPGCFPGGPGLTLSVGM